MLQNCKLLYYELHGFYAFEKAYGAVIYLCTLANGNKSNVMLLCSRSHVAALTKQQTLLRLEFCAALLLAELTQTTVKILNISLEINLWTDSTIVLSPINSLANTCCKLRTENLR